jgi:RND superfamily putative drug exporter
MVGFSVAQRGIRDYYNSDIEWIIIATLIVVFLVLVAVGTGCNLLLISGVIRTVGSTGGVITSAGLIFATSMFGLTASSVSNIVQVGFIIGVGLLLDAFVVRTITVPAMAVIVGKANWWPSGRSATKHRLNHSVRSASPTPARS